MKRNSICVKEISGEEGEEVTENIFKAIMAEKFPKLGREIDIQIQETQSSPNRLNPEKGYTGTHYKCQKAK